MADPEKDERFERMRAEKAPTPTSVGYLGDYIDSLIEGPHTYNTCVPAMSLAAVAAMNLVASKLGVTGFQFSCADLDVLRRTRDLEAGIVINFENALYPQYDLPKKLQDALDASKEWLATKARERLEKDYGAYPPHPDVLAHWRKLAEIDA